MRSHLATSFNQYQNTRSLLAISFNQFGIPSGDSFFNQHEKRGPIWRPSNSETRDPFWRSPLINLESHLAIPFIQTKYKVPSGDLQIAKYEIPSGDLLQLGIPSGDSYYSTGNTRSHLATSK